MRICETPLATDIRWSPFGPVSGFRFGDGSVHTRSYDRSGRITRIVSGAVLDLAYQWDPTDNLTAIADLVDTSHSQTFGYDALHRLTQAQGGYGLEAFDYDPIGNRTRRITDTTVTDYTYAPDCNRLTGVDGTAFSYDAAGNTLSDGERQFVYDARHLGVCLF